VAVFPDEIVDMSADEHGGRTISGFADCGPHALTSRGLASELDTWRAEDVNRPVGAVGLRSNRGRSSLPDVVAAVGAHDGSKTELAVTGEKRRVRIRIAGVEMAPIIDVELSDFVEILQPLESFSEGGQSFAIVHVAIDQYAMKRMSSRSYSRWG
jgi:hypothetical protein